MGNYLGSDTSTVSLSLQDFVKDTVLNSLSETNITNIMTTTLKNYSNCSSSQTNINEIGSGKQINSEGNIVFSNINIDQSITFKLSCLSDDKIFNQLVNEMSNKILADLKNSSNTDIKNLLDSKVSNELGSVGTISSTTISDIRSRENVLNNIKNKINGVIENNLNSDNKKICINDTINKSSIGSDSDINSKQSVYFSGINIKQSTSALSNCIFTTEVKNSIANMISNDLSNKTVNDQKTTSSSDVKNSAESKGIGSMFKSILDGIGGVISSSLGLFIILGICGLGFLYYMAKGGGNDLAKEFKFAMV